LKIPVILKTKIDLTPTIGVRSFFINYGRFEFAHVLSKPYFRYWRR